VAYATRLYGLAQTGDLGFSRQIPSTQCPTYQAHSAFYRRILVNRPRSDSHLHERFRKGRLLERVTMASRKSTLLNSQAAHGDERIASMHFEEVVALPQLNPRYP
jgi:hypothetical protein